MPNLPAGFVSRTAAVKDFRMHYVIGGDGPAIVIVHGGCDSWWAWRDVIPTLAMDHTVILPALRGFAKSSKPAGGYDMDNLGDDIHSLLTEHLGIERFALVGHDWGANACYTLAAQYPQAVSKLAIFETVLPGSPLVEEWLHPQPEGKWLWQFALCTVPDAAEMLIRNNLREYLQIFYSAAAVPDAVTEESVDHYVSLYSEAGALTAYMKYYQNYWIHADQIREHMTTKLTMPVLAYGGDAACAERTLECMQAAAEDVRGGVIPNCGHWIAEERPEFVLSALQEFLGEPDREMSSSPAGA
jgi:pimeloyl-ACP methyl ester carboxylesterase